MKIVKFHAENIKKLRVVDITPTGSVVQITGPNASGKSSVLDSIFMALGGAGAVPAKPVREGETHGLVELDLGDLVVKRRFLASGSTALQVESKDGAEYRSPQGVLDKLMGRLTFDPLEFTRLKPAQQAEQLRSIVELDIDLDELDRQNAADYAARTDVNREAKQLRAQAAGITVPEGLPDEPVDTQALLEQIEGIAQSNLAIERAIGEAKQAALRASNAEAQGQAKLDEAARLRARAAELEAEGQKLKLEAEELRALVPEESPVLQDTAPLREQLRTAQDTNEAIRARQHQQALLAEAEAAEKRSAALTAAMEARTQKRADAIAAANLPVPGLGFGDGGVTFNDLPFDQASGAEQLRVSVAIAMAMNPNLRVLRIKDGSLLDRKAMRVLTQMADERDYQVWIECVDDSGTVGIVMEDGAVKDVLPAEGSN